MYLPSMLSNADKIIMTNIHNVCTVQIIKHTTQIELPQKAEKYFPGNNRAQML